MKSQLWSLSEKPICACNILIFFCSSSSLFHYERDLQCLCIVIVWNMQVNHNDKKKKKGKVFCVLFVKCSASSHLNCILFILDMFLKSIQVKNRFRVTIRIQRFQDLFVFLCPVHQIIFSSIFETFFDWKCVQRSAA